MQMCLNPELVSQNEKIHQCTLPQAVDLDGKHQIADKQLAIDLARQHRPEFPFSFLKDQGLMSIHSTVWAHFYHTTLSETSSAEKG